MGDKYFEVRKYFMSVLRTTKSEFTSETDWVFCLLTVSFECL
jgi:hypothetical protein